MKRTLGYIFLESFLIGLSILTAFWLDGFRQQRETDKIKLEYYNRIKSDLSNDNKEWNKIKTSVKIQKGIIDSLIKKLQNPTGDLKEITKALFRFENEMLYYDIYTFNDLRFTLKSIVNGERGNIFENDTTFLNIQEYYVIRDMFIEDIMDYETYNTNYITPYMDKHFDRACIRFNPDKRFQIEFITPPKYKLEDFKNLQFTNYLINARNHLMIESYVNYILEYSSDMIIQIDKKINL